MNNNKRVVLFAINAPKSEHIVEKYLSDKNIGWKKVQGCFQSDLKDSYVVDASEDTTIDHVTRIANSFGQKCILIVDETRKASLKDLASGDVTKLGDFRAVTALEAKELDSWTLDGGQYYAVV